MTTDIQVHNIKQEAGEDEDGQKEGGGESAVPMMTGIIPSSTATVAMPFVNGIPIMAANAGVTGGNPVLVVPQPFPQFMQFYRPQFQAAASPPVVTAPYALEAGALDLSKGNGKVKVMAENGLKAAATTYEKKKEEPEPGEVTKETVDARKTEDDGAGGIRPAGSGGKHAPVVQPYLVYYLSILL